MAELEAHSMKLNWGTTCLTHTLKAISERSAELNKNPFGGWRGLYVFSSQGKWRLAQLNV